MGRAIRTVTHENIADLKWARKMAADWRGNQNPETIDEFDGWIADVDVAIRAVIRDRKRLRNILARGG